MNELCILIATPAFGGQVTAEYAGSLADLAVSFEKAGIRYSIQLLSNESQVHRARNKLVEHARARVFTHLLFVDADLKFKPGDALKLLAAGKRICGGTYPVKKLPLTLNFNPFESDGNQFFSGVKTMDEYKRFCEFAADSAGLVKVEHVPTGFLLIDMDVFEKMSSRISVATKRDLSTGRTYRYEEFFCPGIMNNQDYSEDWAFCEVARRAGEDVWLHTEVVLPHIGSYVFDANGGEA